MCFQCELGYGKLSPKGYCQNCEEIKAISILKTIGILLLVFLYICYTAKLYKNMLFASNTEIKVLLKILISHFQQNALITSLNLNWSVEIQDFFGIMQVF